MTASHNFQDTYEESASDAQGPMKILSPMSEHDEAEMLSQRLEDEMEEGQDPVQRGNRWQRKLERALTKMSAEVAALREQITTGREWRAKKEKSFKAWLRWFSILVMKHLAADLVILALVLLWMRRRKDPRLENLVRATLRLVREYVRNILPSR